VIDFFKSVYDQSLGFINGSNVEKVNLLASAEEEVKACILHTLKLFIEKKGTDLEKVPELTQISHCLNPCIMEKLLAGLNFVSEKLIMKRLKPGFECFLLCEGQLINDKKMSPYAKLPTPLKKKIYNLCEN
jgi:hypothetical protein